MSNAGGLYDRPAPPDRLGPTSVPALPIQPPLTPPLAYSQWPVLPIDPRT